MREHKYRAWDTLNKKMYHDVYVFGFDGTFGFMTEHGELDMWDTLILMESAHNEDKNGVALYKHDIVLWEKIDSIAMIDNEMAGKYGVVKFHERQCSFGADFTDRHSAFGLFTMEYSKTRWKLVGNIYENPELLKEA